MTLTKRHEYVDSDGERIGVDNAEGNPDDTIAWLDTDPEGTSDGFYVDVRSSVPLALNILGHDRPDDDPLATRFAVESSVAHIASTQSARDIQLNLAAALLKAVDGYDRRAVRLATAAERRAAAAKSLGDTVAVLRRSALSNEFADTEIGKLREALGRYDAALAN